MSAVNNPIDQGGRHEEGHRLSFSGRHVARQLRLLHERSRQARSREDAPHPGVQAAGWHLLQGELDPGVAAAIDVVAAARISRG